MAQGIDRAFELRVAPGEHQHERAFHLRGEILRDAGRASIAHAAGHHQENGLVLRQAQQIAGFLRAHGLGESFGRGNPQRKQQLHRQAALHIFVEQVFMRHDIAVHFRFFPEGNAGVVRGHGKTFGRKGVPAPQVREHFRGEQVRRDHRGDAVEGDIFF